MELLQVLFFRMFKIYMCCCSVCRSTKERMDGESEGLRRQLARLELTIKAEMEKCKVLQVSQIAPASAMLPSMPLAAIPL